MLLTMVNYRSGGEYKDKGKEIKVKGDDDNDGSGSD